MDCLSDRCLVHLAGTVNKKEQDEEAVNSLEHLRECARCRETLSDLRQSLDKLEEEVRYDGMFSS